MDFYFYAINTTNKEVHGVFQIEILGKGNGRNVGSWENPVYENISGNIYERGFCMEPDKVMEIRFDTDNAIWPMSNVRLKVKTMGEGTCPYKID